MTETKEHPVGTTLRIFWPADGKYYRARVEKIDDSRKTSHHVLYDDGATEWLNLGRQKFDVIPAKKPAGLKRQWTYTASDGSALQRLVRKDVEPAPADTAPKETKAKTPAKPRPALKRQWTYTLPNGSPAQRLVRKDGETLGKIEEPETEVEEPARPLVRLTRTWTHVKVDGAAGTRLVRKGDEAPVVGKPAVPEVPAPAPAAKDKQASPKRKKPSKSLAVKKVVASKSHIGTRVKLLWPEDQTWWVGTVVAFRKRTGESKIVYETGQWEWINLDTLAPEHQFSMNVPRPQELTGTRVRLFWPDDSRWYSGTVVKFKGGESKILYDGGTFEWINLDRLHEKHQVQYFAPEPLESIGTRVKLLWPEDNTWYIGTIVQYSYKTGKSQILYEDGSWERLNLDTLHEKHQLQYVAPNEEDALADTDEKTAQLEAVVAAATAASGASDEDVTMTESAADSTTDSERPQDTGDKTRARPVLRRQWTKVVTEDGGRGTRLVKRREAEAGEQGEPVKKKRKIGQPLISSLPLP